MTEVRFTHSRDAGAPAQARRPRDHRQRPVLHNPHVPVPAPRRLYEIVLREGRTEDILGYVDGALLADT